MTMEDELKARIAILVEKNRVLDEHCDSYKKELKKMVVDYECKISNLTEEIDNLKGKLDAKHCPYDNCWLHGKSPFETLKEKVEHAFRKFTIEEVREIGKVYPNFPWKDEARQDSQICSTNMVLEKRKKEILGIAEELKK